MCREWGRREISRKARIKKTRGTRRRLKNRMSVEFKGKNEKDV